MTQESLGEALARRTNRITSGLEHFPLQHEPQGPVSAQAELAPTAARAHGAEPGAAPGGTARAAPPARLGQEGLSTSRTPHGVSTELPCLARTPQGPWGRSARCPQLWPSSSRTPSPTRPPRGADPECPRCQQAGWQPRQNPAGTHSARAAPRGRSARARSTSPQPCGGEEGENSSQPELPAVRGSPVAAAPSLPLAPLPPTHPLPPVSLTHRLRRAASRERARGSLEPRREGLPSLSLTSGSCSWMGPGHS